MAPGPLDELEEMAAKLLATARSWDASKNFRQVMTFGPLNVIVARINLRRR